MTDVVEPYVFEQLRYIKLHEFETLILETVSFLSFEQVMFSLKNQQLVQFLIGLLITHQI